MENKNKVLYHGVGRRKSSIAQVFLTPGTGKILANNKELNDFFSYKNLVQDLLQPLVLTDTLNKFDINIKLKGGGFTGQAGAARLGIARALISVSSDYRNILKPKKMLVRDARVKERKKYGLKSARKAPQYSKR